MQPLSVSNPSAYSSLSMNSCTIESAFSTNHPISRETTLATSSFLNPQSVKQIDDLSAKTFFRAPPRSTPWDVFANTENTQENIATIPLVVRHPKNPSIETRSPTSNLTLTQQTQKKPLKLKLSWLPDELYSHPEESVSLFRSTQDPQKFYPEIGRDALDRSPIFDDSELAELEELGDFDENSWKPFYTQEG